MKSFILDANLVIYFLFRRKGIDIELVTGFSVLVLLAFRFEYETRVLYVMIT